MKSSTRITAIAAAGAATAIALAGCSTSSPGATSSSGGAYKLSFVQGVAGDQFYVTMNCGVQAQAKKLGVTVDVQGPQKFDPTLQKPIVDSVVTANPNALLIAPTDVNAMQAPLNAAAAAGIKVVLVDTTVKDPSFATSQISSNNHGGGEEAFRTLAKLAPAGGKVLVISTDPGVSTVDARIAGFEAAATQDSKFGYLGVQYSHNDPATAAKLITAALAKDPDIVGVFATNIYAASGAATGVRQAAKTDQVKIVGFDAGPDQVKQLKDGVVQALIAQDPYQIGVDGVNEAVASLSGKPVTEKIQTGFHVLTKDNIDGEGAQYAYKSTCS